MDRQLSWSKLQPELGSDRAWYADAFEAAALAAQSFPIPTRQAVAQAQTNAAQRAAQAFPRSPGQQVQSATDDAARLARARHSEQQKRDRDRGR